MVTIVLQVLGWAAFVLGVLGLGLWLRRHPTKEAAERSSRIAHALFFAGLVTPVTIGIFYPGFTHFDALLGLTPLPLRGVTIVIGLALLLPGAYLSVVSNRVIRMLGQGANAFVLTRHLMQGDIYQRTRNPMSLGYYMVYAGIALLAGSTYLTLLVVLGLIPAHIFFLRYCEELELLLRFGPGYLTYRSSVPFLFPRLTR